jgi:hypothetical protein
VPVKLVASEVPAVANPATTQLLVSNVVTPAFVFETVGFVELVLKLLAGEPIAPTPEY